VEIGRLDSSYFVPAAVAYELKPSDRYGARSPAVDRGGNSPENKEISIKVRLRLDLRGATLPAACVRSSVVQAGSAASAEG